MNAFLVENADYSGYIELPVIKTSSKLPEKIVTFSKPSLVLVAKAEI